MANRTYFYAVVWDVSADSEDGAFSEASDILAQAGSDIEFVILDHTFYDTRTDEFVLLTFSTADRENAADLDADAHENNVRNIHFSKDRNTAISLFYYEKGYDL